MSEELNIFFSFKHEDEKIAVSVKNGLLNYCSGVQIYLSKSMTTGDEWSKWIDEYIAKAKLLFLFYIEPSNTWDWCLYEAGLFTGIGRENKDQRRVICLHSEKVKAPAPMRLLKTVDTSIDSLKDFLTSFYKATDITGLEKPLNSNIQDSIIEGLAEDIHKLISPKKQIVADFNYCSYLKIHIDNSLDCYKNRSLGSATIESDSNTLKIFGLEATTPEGKSWKWDDIFKIYKEHHGNEFVNNLENALYEACEGRTFEKMQSTFRSVENEKIYRPVVDRKITYADGSMMFYVPLIEQYTEGVLNENLVQGTLLTAIIIGNRFREEVIQKFSPKIPYLVKEKEIETFFKQLKGAILNILKESDTYGLLNEDNLAKSFDTPEEKETIIKLYRRWGDIFKDTMAAIDNKDKNSIGEQLSKIKKINTEFMTIATLQYHDTFTGKVRAYCGEE